MTRPAPGTAEATVQYLCTCGHELDWHSKHGCAHTDGHGYVCECQGFRRGGVSITGASQKLLSSIPRTHALILRFDTLPDAELTKNHRRSAGAAHWSLLSKALKAERERAGWLIRAAQDGQDLDFFRLTCCCGHVHGSAARCNWDDCECEDFQALPVAVTFSVCFGDNRRRDLDGWSASTAPWLDALVDLGILVDDSTRYLRRVTYEAVKGGIPGMTITVRGA